jgi:hypothetical protein
MKPRAARKSLLFIHHSCGGQLLAACGPMIERASCIHASHPNGGGLRDALDEHGYDVHEASYGSEIGQNTDLFDWYPKFATMMAKVLAVAENDTLLEDGKTHDVVMFKSCFPNSRFSGVGTPPGDASSRELTVWNAKAAFAALLEHFAAQPRTLFFYLTAPPDAPPGSGPLLERLAKSLLGKRPAPAMHREQGRLARMFNSWLVSEAGWLARYPLHNVGVFDYFDVLTGHGTSDFLAYPSGRGGDAHPSSAGNTKAREELVPALDRAIRRLTAASARLVQAGKVSLT